MTSLLRLAVLPLFAISFVVIVLPVGLLVRRLLDPLGLRWSRHAPSYFRMLERSRLHDAAAVESDICRLASRNPRF